FRRPSAVPASRSRWAPSAHRPRRIHHRRPARHDRDSREERRHRGPRRGAGEPHRPLARRGGGDAVEPDGRRIAARRAEATRDARVRSLEHEDSSRCTMGREKEAVMAKKPADMTTKYLLSEKEMPTRWYNIQADFKTPLPPPLHPGTGQPIGPQD